MKTPIYVETTQYLFSWGSLWFFVGLTAGILAAIFTRKKYFEKRIDLLTAGLITKLTEKIKDLIKIRNREIDLRSDTEAHLRGVISEAEEVAMMAGKVVEAAKSKSENGRIL